MSLWRHSLHHPESGQHLFCQSLRLPVFLASPNSTKWALLQEPGEPAHQLSRLHHSPALVPLAARGWTKIPTPHAAHSLCRMWEPHWSHAVPLAPPVLVLLCREQAHSSLKPFHSVFPQRLNFLLLQVSTGKSEQQRLWLIKRVCPVDPSNSI